MRSLARRILAYPTIAGAVGGLLLCLPLLFAGTVVEDAGAEEDAPEIRNPYYKERTWKVWRLDERPVEGVSHMVREGKEKKAIEVTLEPPEAGKRIYPVDPPPLSAAKPFFVFAPLPEASKTYAGIWDDVYSSWSGLHGYVRNSWRAPDGSRVVIKDQFMHFVDVTSQKKHVLSAGVNFVHQSTTSMGHAIANGYMSERTTNFEKIYFSDCLVTAPAHASFTDWKSDQTSDLYMGHMPTLFNSLGSSNSETMAITKMIIVGGYLPPATKTLLKEHGLYPAAILQLWKAGLPYDVPYGHELRHRIAYKAIGNRFAYPEKYGATALDRGDTSLEFHQYADAAHMRSMVELARQMDVALPEAVFSLLEVEGGEEQWRGGKSAVIVQEPGQDVTLSVSTARSYDLQGLPLSLRWKLLYGNKDTSVDPDPEEPGTYTIRVPWRDSLPEGRTAIALIANNGRFDSNPAILSIYRKKGELPGNGLGPRDYKYSLKHANRRPVLLDVQDQYVKRGKELRLPIQAADPEGYPLAFYKRAGEVGEIDGDLFVWRCPKKAEKGAKHVVTLIASDQTSGNSYGGRQVTLHVEKPELLAHITADCWQGPAPLTIKFSAKDSIVPRGRGDYGWSFYQRAKGRKPVPFEKQASGREIEHTFDKPGFYEVQLTVRLGDKKDPQEDTQVVGILVGAPPTQRPAALQVEGNQVRIPAGDTSPSRFDDTKWGALPDGQDYIERSFRIVNAGDETLRLRAKNPITMEGPESAGFKLTQRPRKRLDPLGSTWFTLRFTPRKGAAGKATIGVHTKSASHVFTVSAGSD